MRGRRRTPSLYEPKPLPKSPCEWHHSSTARIYRVLGLQNNVIPKSMHGVFKVDGHTIIIRRSGPDAKGGKPRMFLDHGGREVPVGRIYQSLCKRDVFRARRRANKSRGAKGRFEWRRR